MQPTEITPTDRSVTFTKTDNYYYVVTSASETTEPSSGWTNQNGFVSLNPNTEYKLWYRVGETDIMESSSGLYVPFRTQKASAEDTIKNNLKATHTPYNATYDGVAHDAFTSADMSSMSGWTAMYSPDGSTYSNTMPKVTNVADSKEVYVKFSNDSYADYIAEYPVKVNPKSIADSDVTVATISEQEYTGSPITPGLTVKFDSVNLTAPTDYTVDYTSNTDAGTAHANLTGTGNYSGTKQVDFNIKAKSITPVVTVSGTYQYQNGTPIMPNYKVEITSGGSVLPQDQYTAKITNNTNAGNGNIEITQKEGGNYTFSPVNQTFTIDKIDYAGTTTAEVDVRSGQITTNATLTLPTLPEGASYAASGTAGGTTPGLISTHSISGTTLTYSTTSQADGTKATITIPVTGATNYNNYSVVVTITAKAKEDAGVSIPAVSAQTYGDTFTVKASKTAADGGTWAWTSSDSSILEITDGAATDTVTVKAKKADTSGATLTVKYESATHVGTSTTSAIKVNPKEVTVSGITAMDKGYDGNTTVSVDISSANLTGKLDGDDLTVTVAAGSVFDSADAGNRTVTLGALSLSGTAQNNYVLAATGNQTTAAAAITQRDLTVTPDNGQKKSFGDPEPVLTYTASGAISGETAAFDGKLKREAGEDVDNYAIQKGTLSLKDNGTFKAANYNLVFAAAAVNFEIQKAAFTDTAAKTVDILKNQTTAQSGTLTAADFFTGTPPADAKITAVTPASSTMMDSVRVDTTGTLSYNSKTSIAAASNEDYTVTITTKNYNNITAKLTFQLTDKSNADVRITGVPTDPVTYGDSFTLKAVAANPGTGDIWTWSSSTPTVLEVTGNGATATVKVLAKGSATITAKYESATTVGTKTTADITAVTREISVKADDKSMTVNAALPTFTVTYGNFASGDTADTVFATKADASTTANGKTTGTFDITVTAPTLKPGMDNKYKVGTPMKGILKVNPKSSSGGGSYAPTVQKPEITINGSGKADLSADGKTATITAAAGYELASVVLNGKEMGKVEKLTGLKTGDKVIITFRAKAGEKDGKEETDKMIAREVSKLRLTARSARTAKKNVKLVVKSDLKAITDAGYTVKYKFYRSTKKSAGYKAVLTKKAPTYVNTYGKKGKMYYYKAKVMIYDKEGNFVAQTALKQCKYASRLWTK